MEKQKKSTVQYWNLLRQVIGNLNDLSAKAGKLSGETLKDPASPHVILPFGPLTLLDRKLQNLNERLSHYTEKSISLTLHLKNIDGQTITDGNLLHERNLLLAELSRITADVLKDIRQKQAFLQDFIAPSHAYRNIIRVECPEVFKEVMSVCNEILKTLDIIIELILAFSRYTGRDAASANTETRKVSRRKILQRVSAHMNDRREGFYTAC